MRRESAAEILSICMTCTDLVKKSIESVKAAGPSVAAQHYESYMFQLWASLVVGIIGPIWSKHPDLRPTDATVSGETYDPRNFYLPKDTVIQAAHLIGRVHDLVAEVQRMLQTAELTSEEQDLFFVRHADLERDIQQAEFSIKQQHPDFADPDPRETIPVR